MAMTRFMTTGGRPHTVFSHIGTKCEGATREFKEFFSEWDREAMCETVARVQIISKFNPPGAAQFGGM